jgi:glycosyltransferase involved in cell wall biosynthesis
MIDPQQPDFKCTPGSLARACFDYRPADPRALPAVSIVTPFFNTGLLFRETVASVLTQSFQQWEWILVNDGSTDAVSRTLLDEFRSGDPRIRVVDHPSNRGLSAARNTGFREARTPYIVLLDSDDLLEPTAVEKWFWHLATVPQHAFVKGFGVGFGAQEYLWTHGFHDGTAFLGENMVDATAMIRRDVHNGVGGFDEETRGGLEDWEFWLKCAARGFWGATVPEYLNWYRRRPVHTDRWVNLGAEEREAFRENLRKRYPHLWNGGFPQMNIPDPAYAEVSEEFPATNQLMKHGPRLLMLVPWLAIGGADKFNLDLVHQLVSRGWEISLATSQDGDYRWLPQFSRVTPDIFALPHFLRLSDYPRFISYLISSRQVDHVLISNSELGYKLLPWLRARHPEVVFEDYCHMEEEGWNNGGYPRLAVQFQEQLDINIVSSEYLRGWMTRRGADPGRIEVCTTNIDTRIWRPDPERRSSVRAAMGIPDSTQVILYTCRLTEQKQPRVFIETIRAVRAQQGNFVALVAGDGPELQMLQSAAGRYGLVDCVQFLGAVSNERVHELMMMADILFLPSKWEGIALVVYEAMASGLAVVGAAVGGQAELVTPGTGILIAPSGPETETAAYTKILVSLLREPAHIAKLKEAARAHILKAFELHQMGERMSALCELAAQNHATQPRPAVPPGLARSTAQEGLEMTRNHPQRFWYAGITDVARAVLLRVQSHMQYGEYDIAVALLEPLLEAFTKAQDVERVSMIETQIARLKAMQAAEGSRKDARVEGPLVSIVIPSYKQASYLPEALESVLTQTHGNHEIIVVNDGSPDDTSGVVRSFQDRHPGASIRLIEQLNGGPSAARNAGMAAARGAFCVLLDADDRIAPTFVTRCLAEMQNDDRIGFVYTNIRRFGDTNDVYELPPFDAETIVHHDNTAAACALIRAAMWKDVGGYNESMREGYEDWDFWVGCIEHGWRGVHIAEPLFEYRVKAWGVNRGANTRRLYLIARIVQNHPSLYDSRTRKWAENTLTNARESRATSSDFRTPRLRICYLIHNLLGVTGGNQTLLQQANALVARGHEVTIVSYSEPPEWLELAARVLRVHPGMSMASAVPPSDVVIATYFLNALELTAIDAPVKLYFAQGDQFAFAGPDEHATSAQMHRMSDASYALPGVTVVANSNVLARRISAIAGRNVDGILPVCVDRRTFHPVGDQHDAAIPRILIVGPDAMGTELEPLAFKGIGDIRVALELLRTESIPFTAVRMSNTPAEIFRDFPCEFHVSPSDETKTALYGTADLLVYASHYDSCPRPPLEAMAAGLPVVCTATEGAQEYCVDEQNCLLVAVKSPRDLASAIRRLLGDRALRDRLIRGGLATADERPVEREWNELERILADETIKVGHEPAIAGDAPPEVSIVAIITRQDESDIRQFLRDVQGGITGTHEILRVNARGGDYGHVCNSALRVAGGQFICVVRDGVRLPEHWCDRLVQVLRDRGETGLVAPVVVWRNAPDERAGTPEHQCPTISGGRFPLRTVPDVCMVFRSSLLSWAGMMNEADPQSKNEPAGFLYRVMLTGAETATIGDVVLVGEDGDRQEEGRDLFHPGAVPPARPGDTFESMKRAVIIALDEARTLEYADRADEAVQRLQREIDRFPESPVLRAELAWLLLRARRFDATSTLIGATPESVKRDPQWLLIAGFAMQGVGEPHIARQCAEKALEIRQQNAAAELLLGLLSVDAGDASAALGHVDRAIAIDPGYAQAHAQRGALLWVQGVQEGARSSLERAFALQPTNPEIIDGYLETMENEGKAVIALRHVEAALALFPDHKRLVLWHIALLTSTGRNIEAAEAASSALATFGVENSLLTAASELRSVIGFRRTMPGEGISLCMIVKNEERDLARCLGSVRELVDEMILVDTGSSDSTRAIGAAMGATIVNHTWNDDFAEARNVGLIQAQGAWILVLDADEMIAPRDCRLLRRKLLHGETPPAGIIVTTRNYVHEMDLQGWQRNDGSYREEAGTGWIGSDKVRIFPNRPDIRFEHVVHETVEESLLRGGIALVRTTVPVHHYGRLDAGRTRHKAERYVIIGRRKLADGKLNDTRSLFELAAQEQELNNHAEAVPLWQRYLGLDPGNARAELGLGVSLFSLDRWSEARSALAAAMDHDPQLREAPVKYAFAALQCGDAANAREVMTRFCAGSPDYVFGQLGLAAALACDEHTTQAHAIVRSIERHFRTSDFFTNLSKDLRRGGRQAFADRVMTLLSERKTATP